MDISELGRTERIFYQALELFPHKTIYANAVNDVTVPYVTAAIEAEDPFLQHVTNGIEMYASSMHWRTHLTGW